MQDDHATDGDNATHYHFIDGDVPGKVLSTAFSTTFSQRRSLDWFPTTFPRRRSLDWFPTTFSQRRSLDWFPTTFPRRRSLDWLPTTFPRQHSLNVPDADGEILNHSNRARVHPTVDDRLTARGAIVNGKTPIEVCGSFQ